MSLLSGIDSDEEAKALPLEWKKGNILYYNIVIPVYELFCNLIG